MNIDDIKSCRKILYQDIYKNNKEIFYNLELYDILHQYLSKKNIEPKIIKAIINLIHILRTENLPQQLTYTNFTTLIPSLHKDIRNTIIEEANIKQQTE